MNLIHQEQILIQDIFHVTVDTSKSGSFFLLNDFIREISPLGPNVSLIEHNTYFDSLLMQRLQSPNTDILSYLQQCLSRCHYVIQKPWHQNDISQGFINYSKQVFYRIKNRLQRTLSFYPYSNPKSFLNNSKSILKQLRWNKTVFY